LRPPKGDPLLDALLFGGWHCVPAGIELLPKLIFRRRRHGPPPGVNLLHAGAALRETKRAPIRPMNLLRIQNMFFRGHFAADGSAPGGRIRHSQNCGSRADHSKSGYHREVLLWYAPQSAA
jgi:hypothetical protein